MPNQETYNVNHVMKGPGKLWLNVALPADGARLKLKATGEPDDVESPNAIFLGMTEKGCTFTQTFSETKEECDEFTGAYRTDVSDEAALIEGSFLEILNFKRLAQMAPNGTLVEVAAAGGQPAIAQLKFGGKLVIVNVPMALITPRVGDPTKFTVVQLYAAHNTAGIKIDVTRKNSNKTPFKLEAQIVPGRAPGDRLATIWTQE